MNKYIISFCISCLFIFISCNEKNLIGLDYEESSGESYPTGPLRIINSKIKTERTYRLDSKELLEEKKYEYYNNGVLKNKIRSVNGNNTVNDYYYDNNSNLIKEIVTEGMLYKDTIYYRYSLSKKLIQKETIHTSPYFVLCDTVFFQYDLEGNLSEWYRRDPYNNYENITAEKNEYSNGLLCKTSVYIDNILLRRYEYNYFNNIKTKLFIYVSSGLLEHGTIYYYQDRLLKKEKGFWGNSEGCTDQVIYEYNSNYELTVKKVYEPPYSSYVDHEIHYEYY